MAERDLKRTIRARGVEDKAVEEYAREVCRLNDVDPDLVVERYLPRAEMRPLFNDKPSLEVSKPVEVKAWHVVVRDCARWA